jgi:hypothetical protein
LLKTYASLHCSHYSLTSTPPSLKLSMTATGAP